MPLCTGHSDASMCDLRQRYTMQLL